MCNWFWKIFNSCSKIVNTYAVLQNSVFNFDRITLQPHCFAWEYFQKKLFTRIVIILGLSETLRLVSSLFSYFASWVFWTCSVQHYIFQKSIRPLFYSTPPILLTLIITINPSISPLCHGLSWVRIGLKRFFFHFKFFKGCLPQILLGPFLNSLTHTEITRTSFV